MFLAGFELVFGIVAALITLFVIIPLAFKLIFKFFWWFFFGGSFCVAWLFSELYHREDPLVVFGLIVVCVVAYRGLLKAGDRFAVK